MDGRRIGWDCPSWMSFSIPWLVFRVPYTIVLYRRSSCGISSLGSRARRVLVGGPCPYLLPSQASFLVLFMMFDNLVCILSERVSCLLSIFDFSISSFIVFPVKVPHLFSCDIICAERGGRSIGG